MLDEGLRAAILALHDKGVGVRTIARMMKLSRGAVRGVVRAGTPAAPRLERNEKAEPHEADIRELHQRCRGNLVRVYEELLLLRGATLSYQALTGSCRRHGIGFEPPKPAGRYVFEPGQEMQHDTSPHVMSIGGVERRVQTASVVLAYSRMRFMQVYPSFNRFTCKVFLDEAVAFFGGACRRCMMDNTHVIVLKRRGGARARPVGRQSRAGGARHRGRLPGAHSGAEGDGPEGARHSHRGGAGDARGDGVRSC